MTDFFKKTFKSYTSNSFKNLADKCTENISLQPHSHKTYLAYPSNEAKDYFIQSFLDKNKYLFGIRFITIQQFVHLSLKISYQKDLLFPSHYELMFFLEERIDRLIEADNNASILLKEYVGDKKERITALSSNLSHIFLDYMLYGKNALLDWKEENNWQQVLYKEVIEKWTSIIDAIENCPAPPFPLHLHIFGVDEIPELYLSFMQKLSSKITFSFYFFSPSPLFWGDLISRKKSAYLDKLFQKKNTSIEERLEFASYVSGDHPLLSHFCEAGKPLYTFLQEGENKEDYVDIEMASDLTYIQKALLYQIKPAPPPFEDDTFTIHSAPSLLREVEVLITNILSTLKKHPGLHPSDITVLAPDMDIYYPYIAYAFAGGEHPFSYAISNLKKSRHNKSLEALELLFSLIDSRFEKDDIIRIFSSPLFGRKCQINGDDIEILKKIIEHTGIRWGFDDKSKSSILDQDEICSFGLFKKGFSHILDLITEKNSSIEFSQVESIGDILFLIENLHADISAFKERNYTLKAFLEMSISFAEKYLYIEEEGDFFFKEIKKITDLARTSTYKYSFTSFKRLLGEIFSKKGSHEKTYERPPITFSSMESSPPVEKTLFFIGLDGESYPKKDTLRSLNELRTSPLYEKKSSPAKKARYYLLKAISSAKTAICFSFTSNNPVDGKSRTYSPLIEEMIHALCLHEPKVHPFTPYAPMYFEKPHIFAKNYKLYLASKKTPSSPFHFTGEEKKSSSIRTIEYKELSLLTRSPSGFFYNLSAKLYENKYFTPTLFDDSEFVLSYLDKSIITKKQVKSDTPTFTDLVETNKLPTALFEKAAKKELLLSIDNEKKLLKKHRFSHDPYINYHLDPNIGEAVNKGSTLFLPAIELTTKEKSYIIKGIIPNLTEKGLISFKKPNSAEIWKFLPCLILLSHLDTEIPTTILFLKEGEVRAYKKEVLRPLLKPLLSYYEKALVDISPVVPEAVDEYINHKSIAFANLKAKLLTRFHDPYLEKGEPKDYLHFTKELDSLSSIFKGDSNEIV
ncbi:MAG: RecBCD enzyme subunit RecC [Chlamydiia bacterium]|nr:RecBCD enzyme subunit RecC [Chlamydiia bacterium]MCH9623918.1 RecBCD enzyme subunit RecC [Chlamydiia bacterium]